jgi:nucleoside-diphosphate-sugar epimerase
MRILVTGSSGQIGTNLCLRLLEEDCDVVGVDVRRNPWTNEIPLRVLDLTRPAAARLLPGGVDLVVHLAANARVYESVLNPDLARQNEAMAWAALEYCRERRVPLIFTSSREVYGNLDICPVPEEAAHAANAESPYGAGKLGTETMLTAYRRCYGLRYMVLRLSNVYGRYDSDIERLPRVVPLFIAQIARGVPVTVYGRDKVLDFTHVDDCVDGIVAAIEWLCDGGTSQTVNVATGRGEALLDLARYIADELGREAEIIISESRPGEVTHYVADVTRAAALLEYCPTIGLREGIRQAVRWRREAGLL